MKHLTAALFATFLPFLIPADANSAASAWQDISGGRIRLVVGDPAPGDKVIRSMLQVDLQHGWKTYWRDPGDAGVPLQADVARSVNAALIRIDYPAPHRFDDGTSVWAGYKEPVAFGLDFERADASRPASIIGHFFLGVCKNICVPVQFEFNVDVKDSAAPTMHHELVAMTLKDLPKAATPEFGVAAIAAGAKTLRIDAALPEDSAQAELFLAAPEGFQFAAPVLKSKQGSKAQFEAKVLLMPEKSGADLNIVAYTLVTDKSAVSGETALSRP
jgi:DsbC/DsbD-like thiol-disulfide interchange protein